MSSGSSERAHGEVQSNPDTSNRDLINAVRDVAAEIKMLRLHLQGKDSKFTRPSYVQGAKFGTNIKPKKVL